MAKTKTLYFCQNCGYESPKWQGRCPSCQEWNTFVEEQVVTGPKSKVEQQKFIDKEDHLPKKITEIGAQNFSRLVTADQEFNRVLGGGIVPGSVILIAGEPGIGKSTLLLQLSLSLSEAKILYVSGEESLQQIRLRSERITGADNENLYLYSETSTEKIIKQAKSLNPSLIIIDSIQTLHSPWIESAPGSVGQIRQSANDLIQVAKEKNISIVMVGHITKEGSIAGPKVLEHMVDTVLQFEGDRHLSYRILRTHKNRFGSTAEMGIYEMQGDGMRQVNNPSEILISQKSGDLSGVAIGATLEGNRPLLIEIQSLVSRATYNTPQRSCTGFDQKRLNMLLAVLEKRAGYQFIMQDVFLNMAGGIKVEDPAVDLAICISLVSSLEDLPVDDRFCFAAEVGLGGELRSVNRMEQRIAEAAKLGFKKIFVSTFGLKTVNIKQFDIEVVGKANIRQVIEAL
ncbi:MAG: DNA repair protein RadA [Candidatus Cyclobacteriaceae bacterium M2_1C_046]